VVSLIVAALLPVYSGRADDDAIKLIVTALARLLV
jgi:hypothetical protein